AAAERSERVDGPRCAEPITRAQNSPARSAELEREFAMRTLEEWRPRLGAAGLIWSPVQRLEEVLDDPQARAMGYFRTLEHDAHGPFETLAPPFSIEGVPPGAARPCPPAHAAPGPSLPEARRHQSQLATLG